VDGWRAARPTLPSIDGGHETVFGAVPAKLMGADFSYNGWAPAEKTSDLTVTAVNLAPHGFKDVSRAMPPR